MKRLIFAGFVVALFSGAAVSAQNNGYTDDVYYNGSQAQQDAKAEAKKQKKQQKAQQDDAAYYNSSGTDNGNNYDGNAQVYNDSYGNSDDSYIDYDDDSYTSRIRRFYYPMYNTGYWGSVYSPFWYDPFYSNPYYGWGGWYTPGFSIGFGWGSGPYWNNCWGMNTWYGYGMFNSWYYPYGGGYGYGGGWGGYGGGYWNGYYAGMYDAGRYNNGYGRGAVNYGPRGSRNGLTTVGNYGRSAGLRSANSVTNTMAPMNGRSNNVNAMNRNSPNFSNDRAMQVEGQRAGNSNNSRNINRSDAIRLDNNNSRAVEIDQNATGSRQAPQQATEQRRGGFFNNVFRGNDNNNNNNSRSVERSPSRVQQRESAPVRSYSPSPAPSRNYSPSPSPSPSRSFGGGGGGGRSVGGRR